MAGMHPGVVAERQQHPRDRLHQRLVVAAGQIGAPDRAGKQRVAHEQIEPALAAPADLQADVARTVSRRVVDDDVVVAEARSAPARRSSGRPAAAVRAGSRTSPPAARRARTARCRRDAARSAPPGPVWRRRHRRRGRRGRGSAGSRATSSRSRSTWSMSDCTSSPGSMYTACTGPLAADHEAVLQERRSGGRLDQHPRLFSRLRGPDFHAARQTPCRLREQARRPPGRRRRGGASSRRRWWPRGR